jgi:hypothetical protein
MQVERQLSECVDSLNLRPNGECIWIAQCAPKLAER